MPLFGKRNFEDAATLCERTCEALKRCFDTILDSAGVVQKLEDNDALVKCLNRISECEEKMDTVSTTVADLNTRQRKPLFGSCGISNSTEEQDDNPFAFINERSIRRAVNRSTEAYEAVDELYALVSEFTGKLSNPKDNETLNASLKSIEECRKSLSDVNDILGAINERLEQLELQVLYAPPSYFGGD